MAADVVIRRLLVADWHGVCPPRKRAAATYLPSRVWPCRQIDRSINQVNRLAGGPCAVAIAACLTNSASSKIIPLASSVPGVGAARQRRRRFTRRGARRGAALCGRPFLAPCTRQPSLKQRGLALASLCSGRAWRSEFWPRVHADRLLAWLAGIQGPGAGMG